MEYVTHNRTAISGRERLKNAIATLGPYFLSTTIRAAR
jgi:hypothetical protein